MANQAIKTGVKAPETAAAPTSAHTAPGSLSCAKCKGTGRAIFVEKVRLIKSVGPCECVKA